MINPQIEESWKNILTDEFQKEYFLKLKFFLEEERKKFLVFPPGPKIFHAFNKTPFEKVKIVILGQDPYHGLGQAHGLCFSVENGVKPPPSLKNIFKELKNDLNFDIPLTGNLENWADQGVFLLNSSLTVRANFAGSHQKIGWEAFTDAIIKKISEHKEKVIFLLWGRFAQEKEKLIDSSKHFILKAAHPSPLSAHNGFFGCKHFSKANELLQENGLGKINWGLNQSTTIIKK